MSIKTNEVCREIMNSKEVVSQRVAEVLVSELSGPGYLKREEVQELHTKIDKILSSQTNALVERVMKS